MPSSVRIQCQFDGGEMHIYFAGEFSSRAFYLPKANDEMASDININEQGRSSDDGAQKLLYELPASAIGLIAHNKYVSTKGVTTVFTSGTLLLPSNIIVHAASSKNGKTLWRKIATRPAYLQLFEHNTIGVRLDNDTLVCMLNMNDREQMYAAELKIAEFQDAYKTLKWRIQAECARMAISNYSTTAMQWNSVLKKNREVATTIDYLILLSPDDVKTKRAQQLHAVVQLTCNAIEQLKALQGAEQRHVQYAEIDKRGTSISSFIFKRPSDDTPPTVTITVEQNTWHPTIECVFNFDELMSTRETLEHRSANASANLNLETKRNIKRRVRRQLHAIAHQREQMKEEEAPDCPFMCAPCELLRTANNTDLLFMHDDMWSFLYYEK